MKTVYLAGPITGSKYDEVNNWREMCSESLRAMGITGLSPMRGKSYLNTTDPIEDCYADKLLSTGHAITIRDRWDAMRCDVLLVNLLGATRVSIGTVMEIAWANARSIPIVVVMEDDNIHQHSMLRECAYVIVGTIAKGLEITYTLLGDET